VTKKEKTTRDKREANAAFFAIDSRGSSSLESWERSINPRAFFARERERERGGGNVAEPTRTVSRALNTFDR